MNAIEQKKLHDTINDLISKANSYDMIKEFFNTNPEVKKFYEKAKNECARNDCSSEPVVFIETIEELLDEIEDN